MPTPFAGGWIVVHVRPPSAETIVRFAPSAIRVLEPLVSRRGETPRIPRVVTVGEGEGTGLGVGSCTPLLWWRSGLSDEGLDATATAPPIATPATSTPTAHAHLRIVMVGEV